ncbi:MAG: prephenate/arogenate dehydrogenase family protein [Pseudomonadota bacterium]|nr:prephenate/arogenate dehydrogenase family protein [Pseudomonadota bacterium]
MTQPYNHIAIIGIGLIGSSLALATKRILPDTHISLYDHADDVRAEAGQLGLGTEIHDQISAAVSNAELVVLAVPVGAMAEVMAELADSLKPDTVITDTGSTKRSVIKDISPLVPDDCHFIPSHPLAGTEFSGPASGFATLFEKRYWLILPNGNEQIKIDRLAGYLGALGAMVEFMDTEYHDRVLAITSHLPHLIAYTIVGTAVDLETQLKEDVVKYSASGFRDFTRIAASDPTMWRDVFINNDEAVLEMLQRFTEDLSYLQRAIRWKEKDKLFELFTRTRDIRRSIIDMGQDS